MLQKPPALRNGDMMIRAVAPASTEKPPAKLNRSLAKLHELGFEVSLGDCVRNLRTWGYQSETDKERAEELNPAFRDNNVRSWTRRREGCALRKAPLHPDSMCQ